MKTDGVKTSTHKVLKQEQLENAKNSRIKLKELQSSAENKENLVGRVINDKEVKFASDYDKVERNRNMAHKCVQTGEAIITAEDLTSDEPSLDYWKRLAKISQHRLDNSLEEKHKLREQNEILAETMANLLEENRICKEMLEESKCLVEVLQEMLEDGESDANTSQNQADRTEHAEEVTED